MNTNPAAAKQRSPATWLRAVLTLGIALTVVACAAWLLAIPRVNLFTTSTIAAGCILYGAQDLIGKRTVSTFLMWAGLLLIALGFLGFMVAYL